MRDRDRGVLFSAEEMQTLQAPLESEYRQKRRDPIEMKYFTWGFETMPLWTYCAYTLRSALFWHTYLFNNIFSWKIVINSSALAGFGSVPVSCAPIIPLKM